MTFIEGHTCTRNQKLQCPFSLKFHSCFRWNSVCCHVLVCWSLCWGRKLYWCDFIKYMISIVLCWDTGEPICLMMVDTTKLYSLIPAWNDLDVHSRAQCQGKLELVQSFWWKVAWSNWNVDYGWFFFFFFFFFYKGEDWRTPVWQIWIVWALALFVPTEISEGIWTLDGVSIAENANVKGFKLWFFFLRFSSVYPYIKRHKFMHRDIINTA